MLAKIQSFYGFTKMPFGRDIAPGQLHRHHGHAEAVARLTWAITTRSLAVLTGEVGAGKTVAVRAALAGTDPVRYRPIYLPNPAGIGIRGICQQVVIACGQAHRFHTGSLLPQAADALAAEAAERGRTPILILDEAHQLDAAQLETIRMLTSYDLDSVTCFAALLIGQPTLRTRSRHRRPGRRPRRDHRSHRDTLSTTRDTPSTTQPRQAPPGGVFHNQDIPKISVTDILKINAAQQVSTEDHQDPVTSLARQRAQAGALVAGHGRIVAEFFDAGQSRTLAWARRPQAAALVAA